MNELKGGQFQSHSLRGVRVEISGHILILSNVNSVVRWVFFSGSRLTRKKGFEVMGTKRPI
jgi:hypothetical protein